MPACQASYNSTFRAGKEMVCGLSGPTIIYVTRNIVRRDTWWLHDETFVGRCCVIKFTNGSCTWQKAKGQKTLRTFVGFLKRTGVEESGCFEQNGENHVKYNIQDFEQKVSPSFAIFPWLELFKARILCVEILLLFECHTSINGRLIRCCVFHRFRRWTPTN